MGNVPVRCISAERTPSDRNVVPASPQYPHIDITLLRYAMKLDSAKTVEAVIQDFLQVKSGHNEKPSSGNAEGAIQHLEQAKAAFAQKSRHWMKLKVRLPDAPKKKKRRTAKLKRMKRAGVHVFASHAVS